MAWISTQDALRTLGVHAQTLYANVSRGRIRAKPDPRDSRRSLYASGDVARLAARRRGRRKAADVAAESIGWGEPVLAGLCWRRVITVMTPGFGTDPAIRG
jgi:citrate synthase